jgi:thymidylate synthase
MYLSTDGSYENIYDETDQTVIDQISILINDLKTNPDSRRLMVSAWNVGELEEMVLPPCHYGFQIYTRKTTREEKIVHPGKYRAISLMWNQRSVDTFLGLPFNIASYGLLLMMIADEVGMLPDELIGNLGDVHLYSNHIEQAKEQISREPYELPTLNLPHYTQCEYGSMKFGIWDYEISDIVDELNNYQSHPKIKAPLSN